MVAALSADGLTLTGSRAVAAPATEASEGYVVEALFLWRHGDCLMLL